MFPWDLDRSYSVPSSSLITKKGNKHAVHDFIKWRLLLRLATDEINHNLHPLAHLGDSLGTCIFDSWAHQRSDGSNYLAGYVCREFSTTYPEA